MKKITQQQAMQVLADKEKENQRQCWQEINKILTKHGYQLAVQNIFALQKGAQQMQIVEQ